MMAPPLDQRLAAMLAPPLARLGIPAGAVAASSLVLSLAAAGLFAWGAGPAVHWAAGIVIFAHLLDHIDDEVARLAERHWRGGQNFAAVGGGVKYAALVVGIGIGLWRGAAGDWAIVLAVVAAFAIALDAGLGRRRGAARGSPPASRRRAGPFELEDAVYLMGPVVWLGGLVPLFVAACLGALLHFTVRASLHVLKG